MTIVPKEKLMRMRLLANEEVLDLIESDDLLAVLDELEAYRAVGKIVAEAVERYGLSPVASVASG